MILVDSSIWITSSRKRGSVEANELRSLLEKDEVATTEVVIAEVLQGAKTEEDFNELLDSMDALHFFPANRETWERAAHISFELKTRGLITPLPDLVIAAVAMENDLPVYAADDHFSRVIGLQLHRPI